MEEVKKESANLKAKKVVVDEIIHKIKNSKSVILVQYEKITVAEVSALRNKCREASCEYKVYKNTLVRRAFNELGFKNFDADLQKPMAFVFGADETGAAKIIHEAAKTYDGKLTVKSAFVDNSYCDKNAAKALANMPSREELVAKMLGSMQAPIANFAGVLNNLLSGIVRVLHNIAEQKA